MKKRNLVLLCATAVASIGVVSLINHGISAKPADVTGDVTSYTILADYTNRPAALAGSTSTATTNFDATPARYAALRYRGVYEPEQTDCHVGIGDGGYIEVAEAVSGMSKITITLQTGAVNLIYGYNGLEHSLRVNNNEEVSVFGNYFRIKGVAGGGVVKRFKIVYDCQAQTAAENVVFAANLTAANENLIVEEWGTTRLTRSYGADGLSLTFPSAAVHDTMLATKATYTGDYVASFRLKNKGSDGRVLVYLGLDAGYNLGSSSLADHLSSFELNPGNWVRANNDGSKIVYNTKIPNANTDFVDYSFRVLGGEVTIYANGIIIATYSGLKTDGHIAIGRSTNVANQYVIQSFTVTKAARNSTSDFSTGGLDVNAFAYPTTYEIADGTLNYTVANSNKIVSICENYTTFELEITAKSSLDRYGVNLAGADFDASATWIRCSKNYKVAQGIDLYYSTYGITYNAGDFNTFKFRVYNNAAGARRVGITVNGTATANLEMTDTTTGGITFGVCPKSGSTPLYNIQSITITNAI